MRKVTYSIIAVLLALVSIAASARMATVYYIHHAGGVAACFTEWHGGVCPAGTQTQCKIDAEGVTLWVCKKIDSGPCSLHLRNVEIN